MRYKLNLHLLEKPQYDFQFLQFCARKAYIAVFLRSHEPMMNGWINLDKTDSK